MNEITWEKNRIRIHGRTMEPQLFVLSKAYFEIVQQRGYKDVILDLTSCEAAFENFMLPAVCLIQYYFKTFGAETFLNLPENQQLNSLFHNCNWQHLISPNRYEPSTFEGHQHVPAKKYSNADEQFEAVNSVLNATLASLENLDRDALSALEWTVNEITDNVLNHANSSVGGFFQATTYADKVVEFVVSDAGLTIPRTLGISDPARALEEAVKEGVTSNKKTNQGNGLYGSFRIATLSGGNFRIHSGHASLVATPDGVKYQKHGLLFPGTVVVARVNCAREDLLEKALQFEGKPHRPGFDFIDQKYETANPDEFIFVLREESRSYGSRDAGKPIRTKLKNIINAKEDSLLVVDLNGVNIISSSFADEVFGMMFAEMGPLEFMSRLRIENANAVVKGLIDRAIKQRVQAGL